MNVRIEYGPVPIRNITIQCPTCKEWLYEDDVTEDKLDCIYQIGHAHYHCPLCGFGWCLENDSYCLSYGDELHIEWIDYQEIHSGRKNMILGRITACDKYSEMYIKIRSSIDEMWPDYKKQYANDNILNSAHAKKLKLDKCDDNSICISCGNGECVVYDSNCIYKELDQ